MNQNGRSTTVSLSDDDGSLQLDGCSLSERDTTPMERSHQSDANGETEGVNRGDDGTVKTDHTEVTLPIKPPYSLQQQQQQQQQQEASSSTYVTSSLPPHIRNTEVHPAYVRYGIPLYLLGTMALLLASDIGSGVAADIQLTDANGQVLRYENLLTVSVFTSITELWKEGSFALAVLIVITSISWPYVKLILSLLVWMAPLHISTDGQQQQQQQQENNDESCGDGRIGDGTTNANVWIYYLLPIRPTHKYSMKKWERLIEWVDALGKWSFVDIFVLIIMMVAFRSTIPIIGGIQIDVIIVPKWGFHGFVAASILSMIGTQLILWRHRLVMYTPVTNGTDTSGQGGSLVVMQQPNTVEQKVSLAKLTKTPPCLVVFLIASTLGLQIAGSLVSCFTFTYEQGAYYDEKHFSLLSMGQNIPDSSLTPDSIGIRWIQAFYILLGFVMPIVNWLVFAVMYLWPMTPKRQKQQQQIIFYAAEVAFAWSAVEVFFVSAVFSVTQIPQFGTGIVESGCQSCYIVGSSVESEFAIIVVAAVLNVVVSFWLIHRAHSVLYCPDERRCCCCRWSSLDVPIG